MATPHTTITSTRTSEQESGPLSRAVGGGSPSSSSPLSHDHSPNGGFPPDCAFIGNSDACVQTCITIDPASVFTTFFC